MQTSLSLGQIKFIFGRKRLDFLSLVHTSEIASSGRCDCVNFKYKYAALESKFNISP